MLGQQVRTAATGHAKRKCRFRTLLDVDARVGCAVGLLSGVTGVLRTLGIQRRTAICDWKMVLLSQSIYGRQ